MSNQQKQTLSAQVVLRPASGKSAIPPEQITAENVREIMPSPEDTKKAQEYFSEKGFEVGAAFANSFSITGEADLFEKLFDTKITTNEKNAVKARDKNKKDSSELSKSELPKEIEKTIETITFSEPPDFGPGNF